MNSSISSISAGNFKNHLISKVSPEFPKTSAPKVKNVSFAWLQTDSNREQSARLLDKLVSSHFNIRVKRSPTATDPSHSSVSTPSNGSEILDLYDHLNNLDQPAPISPVCTRGVEGEPNPPVHLGYQNWEAFLASDGANSEIKNPKQELLAILRSRLTSFVLNQGKSIGLHYDAFKNRLNSSLTPNAAKTEFERCKTKINNEYLKIIREEHILREAIVRKMADEIRGIRHNTPNRWLGGHCWSSTTNAERWNQSWTSRYLPQALQASADIPSEHALISVRQIREIWLQKAVDSLKEYFQSKGWVPIEVTVGEPPAAIAEGRAASGSVTTEQ